MKLKVLWKVFSKGVVDNLPTILSVVAVGGLVGSVATAIIDTPKAVEKIEEAKMEKAEKIEREAETDEEIDIYRDEDGHLSLAKIKLSPWEYVTALTPIYWKTGACMILTGGCIFMSNHVSKHRIAMLLAALKLRDKDIKEYEDKIKEMFGEKKAEEVKNELSKDWIMSKPDEKDIIITDRGQTLFYEPLSHTYFRSNPIAVGEAINRTNAIGQANGCVSVADYCYELDIHLKDTYLEDGYEWTFDYGVIQDLLQWNKGTYVEYPYTGETAIVINLNRKPNLNR